MRRLTFKNGVSLLAISAVCAVSLVAGGGAAQAAPPTVQDAQTRAVCTPEVSTVAECFPDAKVATAVAAAAGIAVTDAPTEAQLAAITTLSVANNATSLEGLQYLPKLGTLSASFGSFTDLSPLSDATALRSLTLSYGALVDISQLSGLTDLTTLRLHRNSIEDITPLSSLTALTSLNLASNRLNSVSILPTLTALKTLDLGTNRITDVSQLVALDALTSLTLSANPVTNLDSLAGISTLRTLNLVDFGLSDVLPLLPFTQVTEFDISENQVTDLSPLLELTALKKLSVGENPIRDASMVPSSVTLSVSGALADSPEFPFTRGDVSGSVVLRSGLDAVASTFASHYLINGKKYNYVYALGSAQTTHLMHSSGTSTFSRSSTVGKSELTERGDVVTSRMGGLDRESVREVTDAGSVVHTVTMTNPESAAAPVTTRFYDSADTALNSNDSVPIYSDGLGGFYIENSEMTIYLQPASGIEQAFGGIYNSTVQVRDLVEKGIQTNRVLAASNGREAGDVLASGVDTEIYYVTPQVTLAPGESYTYAYRESLFTADEDALIQVDYVDDVTGDVISGATQSFTGPLGDEFVLTEENMVLPAAYALASSVELPITILFGADGQLTTVQIPVHTAQTYTVTFDSEGGSALAPVEVLEGRLLTLPATPTREGYTFEGWTTDAAGETAFDPATPVTESFTLYAQWAEAATPAPDSFTVTFDLQDGSAVTTVEVVDGEEMAMPADPEREGFTFEGWTTDAAGEHAFDPATAVNGNFTLYAQWAEVVAPAADKHTVTFDTRGGNLIAPIEVLDGQLLTLPADPTRAGFTFAGWDDGVAARIAFDITAPITGDLTLYAQWTAVSSGGGSGSGGSDENGSGNGSGNESNTGSGNGHSDANAGGFNSAGDDVALATTGASPTTPITLGTLAAAGIVVGLVLMVRRRRA